MDDRFPQKVHSSTVASTFTDEQILKRTCSIDGGRGEYRDGSTRDTVSPAGVLPIGVLPTDVSAHLSNPSIVPNEPPVQVLEEADRSLQLGLTYLQNQCYPEALAALEQALNRYTVLDFRAGQVQVLNYLTLAAYSNGDYQNSINFGQRTLVLAHQLDQNAIAIKVLGTIGNAHRHLGNPDRASHFQHESLALAEKIGDHRGSMAALNNLGLVFR